MLKDSLENIQISFHYFYTKQIKYYYKDVLNLFFDNPFEFVVKMSKNEIEYQEFEDINDINNKDCIKFVEEIIECNINKYSKEKQQNFISKINSVLNWLYNLLIKNSKTFYEDLCSDKLFEIEDYLKFLINKKCNVQIACMFDMTKNIFNNSDKKSVA